MTWPDDVTAAIEAIRTVEVGVGLVYSDSEKQQSDPVDRYFYAYGQLEARQEDVYSKASVLIRKFSEDEDFSLLDAYAGFSADESFTDIGKRRIVLGYGFIGSPLDRFLRYPATSGSSREEILQFAEGQYMLYHERFTDVGVYGLGYVPRVEFSSEQEDVWGQDQRESFFLTYNHDVGSSNFTALVGSEDQGFVGLGLTMALSSQTEWHTEALYDTYPKVSGEVGTKPTDSGVRLLVGAAHFFGIQSLLLEFQYNSNGGDKEDIKNFLRMGQPPTANAVPTTAFIGGNLLGRHYALLRHFTRPNNDLELTEYAIYNLSDRSAQVNVACDLFPVEHLRVRAQVQYHIGDSGSEFATDHSGLASAVEVQWSF